MKLRDPERVIPRAIIGSILLVLLLDLGISVAFTGALPWREMIQPGTLIYDAVGSVFMQRVAGFWASQGLTFMILVTAFASVYSMMLGYSRIPYRGGSRRHILPLLRQDPPQQRLSLIALCCWSESCPPSPACSTWCRSSPP